jgi:hypothetical protein
LLVHHTEKEGIIMAYKVVIPENSSALEKDFLQDKGYEIVVGNGNISVEYLEELIADADVILVRPNAPYRKKSCQLQKNLRSSVSMALITAMSTQVIASNGESRSQQRLQRLAMR